MLCKRISFEVINKGYKYLGNNVIVSLSQVSKSFNIYSIKDLNISSV